MAIVFDGRTYAAEKEIKIKKKIKALGQKPTLVSILVGEDPASKLYVSLKQKAAERVGAKIEVVHLPASVSMNQFIKTIDKYNKDQNIQGIMIQLPLPSNLAPSTYTLVHSIAPEKDVDGLRDDSPYLHPTSKAVIEVINYAKSLLPSSYTLVPTVTVVGSTGMVGRPLTKELKKQGYKVIECDSKTKNLEKCTINSDIVISTTGKPNIIRGSMVKKGSIVIDVGSPKGDVLFDEVVKKAAFITPVPGGVGPVTITCLLENLLSASSP